MRIYLLIIISLSCAKADLPQTDFLLVADIHGFSVINLVNGDLGDHVFHNLSGDVSNIIAIDFDVVKKRVYFSDVTTKRILSSTIDGEDVRVEIINNEIATVDGLAIDSHAQLLFYTDTGNDIIRKLNMIDYDDYEDVISTKMSDPRTIVLDITERMIYWTDWGEITIERATYEGTEREILLTESHLFLPNGLAIDFQERRLYWVDAGYNHIVSANLDGTNVTEVASLRYMHTFGMALYKDMYIISDVDTRTVFPIWKNLSVGNIQAGFERPCDIHVYQECPLLPAPTNGSVNYSNSIQYGSTAYFNCDNNFYLLGKRVLICQTDGSWSGPLPECKKIDLPQTDFLLVADIHGFDVINLVNGDLGNHVFHNLSDDVSNMIAIDFDVVKKRVYFSDVTTKRILSSTIDGEDVRIEIINNETATVDGLAIDSHARLLFYTDTGNDIIRKLNMNDYDDYEDVISTNMSEPRTIVLDTTERMIYWTDWGLRTIERATYEGTERETLFTEKHLYFPNGLAIDFQVGRLYWVDAGYDYIGSANLDGTNVTGVATLGSMHTFGIALYKDMYIISDWDTKTVIPIWKNLSVGNTQTGFERPCDIHVYLWEECPLLSAPTNGSVSYSNSNQIGSTAYFNCDNNYYLLGNSVSICQTDGFWNGSLPECKKIDCPLLPAPTNGSVSYSNSNQYGSTAYFNCDNNYYLLGNSVSICQTDGSWNGSLPECKEKVDLGSACNKDDECLSSGAKCTGGVCLCTKLYDSAIDRCDTMYMSKFGEIEGDTKLENRDDVCSNAVDFPLGIPIFGDIYKEVYVCSNGLVSFGRKYTRPSVHASDGIKGQSLLATYYGDIKEFTRSDAGIYYRAYDILNGSSDIASDTVKDIERLVERVNGLDQFSFQTSSILFVTWSKAQPGQRVFDQNKEASFQLVLVSSGTETYALNIYGHSLMQWSANVNPDIFIGYSFGNRLQTNILSFTRLALRIDEYASTNGISGLVLQKLFDDEKPVENRAVECIRWYQKHVHHKDRFYDSFSSMPLCPCDLASLKNDPFLSPSETKQNGTVCYDMWHREAQGTYGKSCCYNEETTLFNEDMPTAGGFMISHPQVSVRDNTKNDIKPKEWCCSKSDFCDKYYELHPTGKCKLLPVFDLGICWGDPHIRTLDNFNFTFNGLGEFTLFRLRTENITFDMQGRTARPVKADGKLSSATVFTAFAAFEKETNASVHVELNDERDDISIYGNKEDLSKKFKLQPSNFTYKDGNIIIQKANTSVTVLFSRIGIFMNITVAAKLLSINVMVPKVLKGKPLGLLGNYDEDPYNDFVYPNGTGFPFNASEREIFSYSSLWEIDGSSSAFVYRLGKNHSDFHNSSYIPYFLDEFHNETLKAQAVSTCGGPENVQCVYDFVFTDELIAQQTLADDKDQQEQKTEIEKVTPELNGCSGLIFVSLGTPATCTVEVSEDPSVSVQFKDIADSVYASLPTTGRIRDVVLTIDAPDPFNLRITATNVETNKTKGLTVTILLCTKCHGHGECIEETRVDERATSTFKYAQCICDDQHEGADCEHVKDGCSADPCLRGQECIRLNVSEQIALNTSYMCGACPDGFSEENDKCVDIDECSEGSPCEDLCNNVEGSFVCSCNIGYRIDVSNLTACTDINECDEGLDNCPQQCINTDGGYNCSCFQGFTYNDTTDRCIADAVQECEKLACPDSSVCYLNKDGNPDCLCDKGFDFNNSSHSCEDIDECKQGICTQICRNYNGGYNCSCHPGYSLLADRTCQECAYGTWGNNCSEMCRCSGEGTSECDRVKGCICNEGYQGDACSEDIDECILNPTICNDARKICFNTIGSYRCECPVGLRLTNGICVDIDECSNPLYNDCEQTCTNTFGGFTCSCPTGFTQQGRNSCQDIDECTNVQGDCAHICANTNGFYQCFCNFGYKLLDDRTNCAEIENPCRQISHLKCQHFCVIDRSTEEAKCQCRAGYVLANDGESCDDIDECSDPTANDCSKSSVCYNTKGSYQCKCPEGMKLENDLRTCSACDEYHYGANCGNQCQCFHGNCDPVKGCICENGWFGDDCDLDLNECERSLPVCPDGNITCVNTPGSFECRCSPGYSNTSGVCLDIDECADSGKPACEQTCRNTPGSYICECSEGFKPDNSACVDVDECAAVSQCDHNCINTIGSYRCTCKFGFKLDLSDRRKCLPSPECHEFNITECENYNATCMMFEGVAKCLCRKGFEEDRNNICKDIDECGRNPCDQDCENTHGSFTCICEEGFFLENDGISCSDCKPGTYGLNCAEQCKCISENTELCDRINGTCTCMRGWKGDQCSVDINECEVVSCPVNSYCVNTNGSYTCDCDRGFAKAGQTCKACEGFQFGVDCTSACDNCNKSNAISCNNVNGACICSAGWMGENCTSDVNECTDGSTLCLDKPNAMCVNKPGSYVCQCPTGYYEVDGVCEDINECTVLKDHGCLHICMNTEGSYYCSCKAGQFGDGNNCTPCNDYTYGINCTNGCQCNANNTARPCDKATGECSCKEGWTGETCDEDINECSHGNNCNLRANTGCHNTVGSYECSCFRGFVLDGQNCVIDSSETTTKAGSLDNMSQSGTMSVTLQLELPNETNLNVSMTYNIVERKVWTALTLFYNEYTSKNFSVYIQDIRIGSIICDYYLLYDTMDAAEFQKVVVQSTLDLAAGKEVTFDGNNISARADFLGANPTRCNVYEALYGKCLHGCVVEDDDTSCRMQDEPNSTTGVVVGIVLGILALLVVAVVMWRLRKRKRQTFSIQKGIQNIALEDKDYDSSKESDKQSCLESELDSTYNDLDKGKLTADTSSDEDDEKPNKTMQPRYTKMVFNKFGFESFEDFRRSVHLPSIHLPKFGGDHPHETL
ncbi:uncharacterized protein LOC128215112 [Mya arenaria]|uniref:uncharacterized protein LOC128215112 n=1 Tax=Mya arenaria TaxID=6604 RepID=UPI0022E8A32E|nr:uncharacterized protein LOC128215112 [Mya arenaria]